MGNDENDKILIGILLVVVLGWGAYSYLFSSEPETYTAEIEMQEDNTILVVTSNVGEINADRLWADRLWVEFECSSDIEISNRSGIVGNEFEYDPTKTFEGDFYSISGGAKNVPSYTIKVRVYYSYEDQDKLIKKLIKEGIREYNNLFVPSSTEYVPPKYTFEIEMQNDNEIMVKTINHAKVNANKLGVEFDCPRSSIEISNRSGIVGDRRIGAEIVKYAFECDPTKTFEGDFYSISGGAKNVPSYTIYIYVNYSYEDQDKLIRVREEEIIEYDNPNR